MEPIDNHKILALLEQELNLLKTAYVVSSGAMIGGSVTSNPLVAAAGVAGDYLLLERIEKINRIHSLATKLVNEFDPVGITIFPRVQVPNRNPLDLFVRFAKTNLIISIRSMGKNSIVFNEKQNSLYVKKANNRGLKIWLPDPLEELGDYVSWVNKNRDLFGLTARQVRQPRAKILLLSGETQIHKHNQHLYTNIGNLNVLTVTKFGTTFVIREEMIVEFAHAFLASQKTSEVQESQNPVGLS